MVNGKEEKQKKAAAALSICSGEAATSPFAAR
jgi:hypothetical protein